MSVARYDAVADYYESSFDDAADPVVRSLLDLLGPVAGLDVLDLACGHGRVTRALAGAGATVTGVDLSRTLLDKAQAASPEIRYVHADAADQGWLPESSFAAVVCSFGLSDIDDLGGTLATVRAALRPGGVFAFSILHPCFPGAPPMSGAWPSDGRYYDEGWWRADGAASVLRRQVGANHRTLATYVNTLARHGLQIEELREPRPPAEWSSGERADASRYPVYLVVRCRRN